MSITNSYASGAISKNTQANKDKYEKEYQESQKVKDAYNALQEHLKNKPGDFSSAYESSMKDIYDRIMNREKFNFDMNSNVMYQQLKDQYAALGKLAMQDTMGQASALTGGYGNSYAQTAGQQTYQNYMQQLNEQLPQLYQMELNRYGMEGDEMYNQYGIAKGMYDSDYAKYRDSMSDFYTDRDYLNGNYQSERDFDYGNYQSNRDYWNSQYWNEKNSATTSVTSGGGSGGSGGSRRSSGGNSTGNKEKSTTESGPQPLSNEFINKTMKDLMAVGQTGGIPGMINRNAQKEYLKKMYNNNQLSESQLNYFYDKMGF